MSPALVIGHPTTLVASVILIPVILAIAVFLPGNQFLPLASLAGMFYLFPMILPFTKGNIVKTLIIGLVALIIGLYFFTLRMVNLSRREIGIRRYGCIEHHHHRYDVVQPQPHRKGRQEQ